MQRHFRESREIHRQQKGILWNPQTYQANFKEVINSTRAAVNLRSCTGGEGLRCTRAHISTHSKGFLQRGLCHHDFMKVLVDGVQVTHSEDQGVSF